jgi:hypothetical protein
MGKPEHTFNRAVLLKGYSPDEIFDAEVGPVAFRRQEKAREHHFLCFKLKDGLVEIEPSEVSHCSGLKSL